MFALCVCNLVAALEHCQSWTSTHTFIVTRRPANTTQVLSWNHETRLIVVLAKDAVFAATTFAILFVGERNGNQRNAIYPRYPGGLAECPFIVVVL